VPADRPRSDAELLGMNLVTRSRGANLLLDVPPDCRGLISRRSIASLTRLRSNLDLLGL
jgi:alpha-L-fucosidase